MKIFAGESFLQGTAAVYNGRMDTELKIRLGVFLGILCCMVLWEQVAGRRGAGAGRWLHRLWNLALVVVDTLCLRVVAIVLMTGMAMGVAKWCEINGVGVLHWVPLPHAVTVVLGFLVLDFAIYVQHVVSHKVPMLWAFHKVHHSDLHIDATTALRFHPVEIVLSMGYKMLLVLFFGVPVLGVLMLEVLLNGAAMFNHGNVRIPLGLDRVLRWFVVTPDMHRIHHSVIREETDSNYGFNLSWWDRLCGTYRQEPESGQLGMVLGISRYRDAAALNLVTLLKMPFIKESVGESVEENDEF